MASRNLKSGKNILAVLLGLTGLGTLIFWIVFAFKNPQEGFLAQICPAWYPWECSFIVADGWMILASFIGAFGLLRQRQWGRHWAGMAGSAILFLALMDILFFLQNGLYLYQHPEILIEALIHFWLLGLGIVLVIFTTRTVKE